MAGANMGGGPKAAGNIELNLVPLIDVISVLILFFILSGQLANASFAAMDLANPWDTQAIEREKENKDNKVQPWVVINVLCNVNEHDDQGDPSMSILAKEYRIGTQSFSTGHSAKDLVDLKATIEAKVIDWKNTGGDPEKFIIELRADQRIQYDQIAPVIEACAELKPKLGFKDLKITALRKP